MSGLNRENLFLIGAGLTCAVFPGEAPSNKDLLKTIVGPLPNKSPLGNIWKRYGEDDIEIALTRMDIDLIRDVITQKDRDLVSSQLATFFERFRFRTDVDRQWLQPLLGVLKPRDSIVTLNYDCFLEGFLDYPGMWSPKGGYGKYLINPLVDKFPDNKYEIIVFKIHGSENFTRDRVDGGNETVGVVVESSIFPKSSAHSNFRSDRSSIQGPAVIAPSYVKRWPAIFADLLLESFRRAVESRRMVIIGCSFRIEDPHLWLLHRAFLDGSCWEDKQVVIIDHNAKEIADRLKKFWPTNNILKGNSLIPLEGEIADGLDALSHI